MSNTITTGNTAILQSLFFGRGKQTKHKLNRDDGNISAELPVTKAGKISASPTVKSPYFSVGLGTTLIIADGDLAPNNMNRIDVTSIAVQGEPQNVDDVLWDLPDPFFDALGVLNDEIESVSGITADDLRQIGLDVERLEQMGLPLHLINSSGMTLEQIAAVVGTSGEGAKVVDMDGNDFSDQEFDGYSK